MRSFDKKSLLTMLLLIVGLSGALAQIITVKGKVTDPSGEPIPGVNVFEKSNITNGVITDYDGHYALKVASKEDILVFSFIGFEKKEIQTKGKNTINVVLVEEVTGLSEVVVTAMGMRRDKKSLGYAVSKVDGVQLVDAGTPINPVQSLYGKAAGVSIRQSASGPTGGININIRGATGLQADAKTRPLFVIDGIPIFDENTGLADPSNEWLTPTDYGTGINDINSDDIESIEILKGAKASVLYGSEGANGVVLITTKSGRNAKDRLQAQVSYQTTLEDPVSYLEFQNKYGAGASIHDIKDLEEGEAYPRARYTNTNFGPAFDASQKRIWWDGIARPYVARPNNYDFLFKEGKSNQINTSISHSGTYGHLRFGFTNYKYEGIMEGHGLDKNSISFAGTFKLSDRFSIETSTNLYSVKGKNRPGGQLKFFIDGIDRGAPFEEFVKTKDYLVSDPTDKNYGYLRNFDESGYPTTYYSLLDYQSYTWGRERNSAKDDKMHIIMMARPKYKITDWLSIAGQASLDYTDTDFTTKNKVHRVHPNLAGGLYEFSRRNTKVEEYKGFLNFNKRFIDTRLSVYSMVGTSYKKVSDNNIRVATANVGSSSGFMFPDWFHLNNQNPAGWPGANDRYKVRSNGFGENTLYSVFGVASVTWDNKYTVEISARNDWSSTLPPDNNSYFYPGVAFTYDATKPLKSIIPMLQFGKFRASWADVGRDAPSRYYAYNSLHSGMVQGTGANGVSAPTSLFAGDLKPERKREFEIGTELYFFKNNRLGVDLTYYNNRIYDQIMSVPLPRTSGASEIKINAGEVKNYGFELEISATPIVTNDFRWDMSFTGANQFSEVVKLYPGITEKNVSTMRGKVYVKAIEGESIGNIYGSSIMRDDKGRRIVNSDGKSYQLDEKNSTLIGNINPDLIGGFNTSLTYKNFRVSAHLDYSYGAAMYSQTNQWMYANGMSKQSLKHRDEANGGIAYYYDDANNIVEWKHNKPTPDGQNLHHDGVILPGVVSNGDGTYSDNDKVVPVSAYYGTFVSWANEAINAVDLKYDNDYVKVRELSLAYTVPSTLTDKLKLSMVRLNLFARNLGYIYRSVPNLDAEAYMGTNAYFEASATPSSRTYGMKVTVGF